MILAGDIGGTKVHLALYERRGRRLERRLATKFVSRRHESLEEVIRLFLSGRRARVDRACFGVAGPVLGGRAETPNLPWVVEERGLSRQLGIERVRLLNDLEAMAYGVLHLTERDLTTLHAGQPRRGNAAVIAAGTGLGQALLMWDGTRHHPWASEGGHADFAPRNREEFELLAYLQQEYGRVSCERVLSGPGIHAIYRFLRDSGRGREPRALAAEIQRGDPSAVIASWAMEKRQPLCVRTLERFVSVYGAEAGNLALRTIAVRGIYLGGGVAPKILPLLQGPTFVRAFLDKGRLRKLLEQIPVRVIRNQQTPLLGAANFAATL